MIRLLVCGGRTYDDKAQLFADLDAIHANPGIALIITGGANGADKLAEKWAADRDVPLSVYPADWSKGLFAGPARNQKMVDFGRPDLVLACPGGNGTADMIAKSCKARISIRFVRDNGQLDLGG